MFPSTRLTRTQRVGFTALVLLAVMMLSAVGYVLATGDDPIAAPAEPVDDEALVLPPKPPPSIVFPERVRTFDLSLNRFIDRFIRTTREGRYDEFRRMWTRTLDPVNADQYLSVWEAVRDVRILEIRRLASEDGAAQDAYLLTAAVGLDPERARGDNQRVRRIVLMREEGQWVMSPFVRKI